MKLSEKVLLFINTVENRLVFVKVEDKELISDQLGRGFRNNTDQKITIEEFMGLIERVRFDINIELGNLPEIFHNMRVDINDRYGTVNFYYRMATGVMYNVWCVIDELLYEAEDEVLYGAIEELFPMDLERVTLQCVFWSEEQRKEYIQLLKRKSFEKLKEYRRTNSKEVFLDFENELKSVIVDIIKDVM
ncbi:hypothetical protein [Bacillus cereus]|uniref:hypothetical protein n=1 Tax=Bacillus cereus TaxID=1396 RepID=UPI000B4C0BE3|nr:hypothetical protein [Bacillus cereus]